MINPYTYIRQHDGLQCSLKEETTLWSRYSIRFPSACDARYLGNTQVMGEYVFPAGKDKAPLAILLHGMGDRSIFPCRLMARTLARKGIASFILYLIFHTVRAPQPIKEKYPRLSPEEWFESYQISVTDVRQVLDWAGTRPELDQEKISVVGISFGSFISSIAMGLDKRIRAGVLIESGGNTDKITRHSLMLRWQYKYDPVAYCRNQEDYARYLSEVEEKGFDFVDAGKSSYLTDPMTFACSLRGRPLLMLNALFDEMIPRVATLDLWKACGKPQIKWFPATHASIWFWYPLIGPQISRFLKASFKG